MMDPISKVLRSRPTGLLYHYTDAKGLIGVIESRQLWASNVMHLNDASEFVQAVRIMRAEIAQRLRDDPSGLDPEWCGLLSEMESEDDESYYRTSRPFVASFSENEDQLSQWRAYCPNGNGFAIGFSYSDLAYLMKITGFRLVKCVYGPDEQSILVRASMAYFDRMRQRSRSIKGFKALGLLLSSGAKAGAALAGIKNEGFVEEKEWRLVGDTGAQARLKHRPGRFGVLPYCELPLCVSGEKMPFHHVVVGPNVEPRITKNAVWKMLQETLGADFELSRVVISRIPFRY
jgi:hypothetical protein